MKKWTIGVTALTMGLAASGIALAQNADGPRRGDPMGDRVITRAEAQTRAGQMFDKLDANHDGKLDAADRTLRMEQRRTKMFDAMDANHDGSISRAEFMAFKPEHRGGMDRDGDRPGMRGEGRGGGHHFGQRGHGGMKMRMMKMADTNNDGAISKSEFVAAALQHFDKVDANHDGKITKEERQAFRQTMRARWHDRGPGPDGGPSPDGAK